MKSSTIFIAFTILIGSARGDWSRDVKSSAISFRTPDVLWWILDWLIPNSLIEENVFFYSYTRGNFEAPEQLWIHDEAALSASHFDVSKKTIIAVHGFLADYTALSAQGLRKEYLTYGDVNVITPDFGNLSNESPIFFVYTAAKSFKIGQFIGQFVMFLIDQGVSPDNIHIIGHSLGAHIAGYAAKYARNKGKLIGRVTGLDPCYLVYEYNTASYRLAPDDAKFTDCIYTTYGVVGMGIPVCKANFFPNGVGVSQPGCYEQDMKMVSACGHSRVVDYFIESINPDSQFKVLHCDGVPKVEHPTHCRATTETLMGAYANTQVSGMFYLKTNARFPYSKG